MRSGVLHTIEKTIAMIPAASRQKSKNAQKPISFLESMFANLTTSSVRCIFLYRLDSPGEWMKCSVFRSSAKCAYVREGTREYG